MANQQQQRPLSDISGSISALMSLLCVCCSRLVLGWKVSYALPLFVIFLPYRVGVTAPPLITTHSQPAVVTRVEADAIRQFTHRACCD